MSSWRGARLKVKLSLCLTNNHAMKTHWEVEVKLHAFLTSALDGGECSASRPGRFTTRERVPGSQWIADWVGPAQGKCYLFKFTFPLRPLIVSYSSRSWTIPSQFRYGSEFCSLCDLLVIIQKAMHSIPISASYLENKTDTVFRTMTITWTRK
jgi:hypothetical protein